MKNEIDQNFEQAIASIRTGPFNDMLEPEYCTYDAVTQVSTIRFRKKTWQNNMRGELHGGVVAAILDAAIGITATALSGQEVSTSDMAISYIRPFVGETFLIRTEAVHIGRKLMRLMAKAYDEETGKCLASSIGNIVRVEG